MIYLISNYPSTNPQLKLLQYFSKFHTFSTWFQLKNPKIINQKSYFSSQPLNIDYIVHFDDFQPLNNPYIFVPVTPINDLLKEQIFAVFIKGLGWLIVDDDQLPKTYIENKL